MPDFSEGDKVEWNWGSATGSGIVGRKHTGRITRTIKGTQVNRKASRDDPAYPIEQEDGDEVLKSGSELSRA